MSFFEREFSKMMMSMTKEWEGKKENDNDRGAGEPKCNDAMM